MPPVHFSFTGYAIVGLTLFILASTITVWLLRLPTKSTATRWLTVFFAAAAASGAATVLANGIPFWDRLFDPWQDAFVILGGVALAQFAYRFPQPDQPREARRVLWLTGALAALSIGYGLVFDYRFIFQWSPDVDVDQAFYILLPLGTLVSFAIFLRRSAHFSARAWRASEQAGSGVPSVWQRLLHPQGQPALSLRSFALALLLGLLPGLASLWPIPSPFNFLMMNIGSLLAMSIIALVYFNYAPEMTSFMAKLIGVTLVTILLSFSVLGSFDYKQNEDDLYQRKIAALAVARTLVVSGQVEAMPPPIAYIVAWDAASADRPLYVRSDVMNFDLKQLMAQNQQQNLAARATAISGRLVELTHTAWQYLPRYGAFPQDSTQADFDSYFVTEGGTTYEIALARAELNSTLNAIALKWMGWLVLCSLFVLTFFPIFFRRMLVNPLAHLLDGVSRANQGDLNSSVPVQYHDEIGALTDSFNALTRTLKESYEVLEQRVTDRTNELSAFADLTMLPASHDDLSDVLQPALYRILEAGKCEALGLHLLSPDEQSLQLITQLQLPESALPDLQTVSLADGFGAHVLQTGAPIIANSLATQADVPACFKLPQFQSYLGCPLTVDEHSSGWLSCYRIAATEFGMSEVSFFVALARQVAVIIENHRLRERIGQVAVDEERQRLARELHDAVTQSLYSLMLFARAGRNALDKGNAAKLRENLAQMEASAAFTLKEMRLLLYQLRPVALQHGRLLDAINERFDFVERRLNVQATCAIAADVVLSADMEDMFYRVTLEALNNALKHANASTVKVQICRDHTRVCLSIQDDGQGFAVEQVRGGMGLSNMQERAAKFDGQLEINALPGGGTEIKVYLPLPASE